MQVVAVERELPPLAAMVRERHEAGHSYREMAEASRRAGHFISHSQIAAYATDGVRKAPTPEALQALAAALGTSFARVYSAAIEQYYGYVPSSVGPADTGEVGAAIPYDLTEDEKAELTRMIRAWVVARREDD